MLIIREGLLGLLLLPGCLRLGGQGLGRRGGSAVVLVSVGGTTLGEITFFISFAGSALGAFRNRRSS